MEPSAVELSAEQKQFISYFNNGDNIVLSAPAGSGKSFVLNYIKSIDKYKNDIQTGKIVYTSSTAISALLIDGTTIHSFLGIGLGNGDVKNWLRYSNRPVIRQRGDYLNSVNTIIIDEFSMISSEFIENMDIFLRLKIKKTINCSPFGGVQIVLTGDVFQLDSVDGRNIIDSNVFRIGGYKWKYMTFTKNHRQVVEEDSDRQFIELINKIKYNTFNSEDFDIINKDTISNVIFSEDPDVINKYTILASTNKEVELYNNSMLKKLNMNDLVEFKPFISNTNNKKQIESEHTIKLSIGCKILITYNINNVLCNGRAGIITNINNGKTISEKYIEIIIIGDKAGEKHIINYIDKKEDILINELGRIKIKQKKLYSYLPVRVGYAITIHKSQGATLENIVINVDRIFNIYQLYVAISRVRRAKDITLVGNMNNIYYLKTRTNTIESVINKKKFISKFIINSYIEHLQHS